jgi:hypothetical protein
MIEEDEVLLVVRTTILAAIIMEITNFTYGRSTLCK